MRRNVWVIIVFVMLSCFLNLSCSKGAKGQPEEKVLGDSVDELLKKAFDAIKAGDWQAYSTLTITSADFVLKAMGISRFKAKQSYVGSSVKPAEIKKQTNQFYKAAKGDDDTILFDKDTFVSAGPLKITGTHKALNNVNIPFKMYSLKIKTETGEIMDDLYPYVVIVKWGEYYRILELVFSADK